FPLKCDLILCPQQLCDLHCFLQLGDSYARRWERVVIGVELGRIPAGSHAEDQSPSGQELKGRTYLGSQSGVAIALANYSSAEKEIGVAPGQVGEGGPAFQHVRAPQVEVV